MHWSNSRKSSSKPEYLKLEERRRKTSKEVVLKFKNLSELEIEKFFVFHML